MEITSIDKIIKKEKVDHFVLFATEQKPVDQKDTFYCAKIIEKKIKNELNIEGQIVKIDKNPADYDEMFNFYFQTLKNYKKNDGEVVINITGGTPAQISNLLLCSSIIWNNNIKIYYMDQKQGLKKIKINEKLKYYFG